METSNTIQIVHTDDDEDDRELFREAISRLSIRATLKSFMSCETMVKAYLGENSTTDLPDIIFLDINMPGKNGLKCLKELKQDKKFAMVPIVMLTTSSRSIDVEESRKFGASLFLNKPGNFKELVGLLDKLLSPEMLKSLNYGKSSA
jgi:CheY-like chemotaxis protein